MRPTLALLILLAVALRHPAQAADAIDYAAAIGHLAERVPSSTLLPVHGSSCTVAVPTGERWHDSEKLSRLRECLRAESERGIDLSRWVGMGRRP